MCEVKLSVRHCRTYYMKFVRLSRVVFSLAGHLAEGTEPSPMWVVVAHAKKMYHRTEAYIGARLAYTATTFNVCLGLFHQLHPSESPFKISIAEFSL